MFWLVNPPMRKWLILISLLAIGLGSLWLWQSQPKREPVAITGVITILTRSEKNVSILVEASDTLSDYDIAQVLVKNGTPIWLGDAMLRSDKLEVGMTVAIQFSGPVRESYPVQATAREITIIQTDHLK